MDRHLRRESSRRDGSDQEADQPNQDPSGDRFPNGNGNEIPDLVGYCVAVQAGETITFARILRDSVSSMMLAATKVDPRPIRVDEIARLAAISTNGLREIERINRAIIRRLGEGWREAGADIGDVEEFVDAIRKGAIY